MIFWFSGTGNSRYVATSLGKHLEEDICFLLDSLSGLDFTDSKSIGFVFPIYSWGIPPNVLKRVEDVIRSNLSILGNKPIWIVCTCGDETALAPEMFESLLQKYDLKLNAGWNVIMPNNYVLLPGFNVDSKELERKKLDDSQSAIQEIAQKIKGCKWEKRYIRGSMPKLKSKIIYPLFKKWGIFPSKWRWTTECVQCGKCASVCPIHNIKLKGGHPSWKNKCISCLACYHICPVHAIEYGKITHNKGQYFCKRK